MGEIPQNIGLTVGLCMHESLVPDPQPSGAAERMGGGGYRGLSPRDRNTLIKRSVSKILSKNKPILSFFPHDND